MKKTITVKKQEELFASECKLINLKYEYRGYKGTERFAIITELTEEQLFLKYPDIIARYTPFVLLSLEHGEVIADAHRLDDKYEKRIKRNHAYFGIDDEAFDEHHPELANNSLEQDVYLNIEIDRMYIAINSLNQVQKSRIFKHFFEGKTMREIAVEEDVNVSSVHKSISAGIENLKKYMM